MQDKYLKRKSNGLGPILLDLFRIVVLNSFLYRFYAYGKCSKISNTLKLRTPKITAENNF